MTSIEISEWMAYYSLKNKPATKKEESQTVDDMKEIMMGFNPKAKG